MPMEDENKLTVRTRAIRDIFVEAGLPEDAYTRQIKDEHVEQAIDKFEEQGADNPGRRREIYRALFGQLNKQQEALAEADIDSVTGLHNRANFNKVLNRELERLYYSPGKILAVGLLDIDNFKQFNDTYGHRVGDTVLRQTAQRLRHACRANDRTNRYGGEELAFIMGDGDTESDRLAIPLQRVREEMCHFTARDDERNAEYHVTNSIGAAIIDHELVKKYVDAYPEETPRKQVYSRLAAHILEIADSAMYQVKKNGKANMLLDARFGTSYAVSRPANDTGAAPAPGAVPAPGGSQTG